MSLKADSHMEYTPSQALTYDKIRSASPAMILEISDALSFGKPNSPVDVIDIGCGSGNFLEGFGKRPLRLRLVGIDTSKAMLTEAEHKVRNLDIQLMNMDMRELDFDKESFDAAYFVHSLHHCGGNINISIKYRERQRIKAIQEVYRVLRPGGRVVLIQSDPWQNEANVLWGVYFPWAMEKKRIIQPTSSDIEKWMSDQGFVNVRSHAFHDYLTRPVFNPEIALDDNLLSTYSEFSYLSPEQLEEGRKNLRNDIRTGRLKKLIEESVRKYEEGGGNFTTILTEKPK